VAAAGVGDPVDAAPASEQVLGGDPRVPTTRCALPTRSTSDSLASMPTIGITGHRGLTPDIEAYARAEIRRLLDDREPAGLGGVSCIADGPDSIFAEEILARGAHLTVILPAAGYRDGLPAEHHALYDELLAKAGRVVSLPNEEPDPAAHMDAGTRLVDESDLLIAVWDGEPSRGLGGTADVVAYARQTGTAVHVLWPAGARRP